MKATIRFWLTSLLAALFLSAQIAPIQAALYNPSNGALDRAGAIFIKQIAGGVNDIASGSTTETVAATFTLPTLGVNDGVDVEFYVTGSGTAGTRGWNLRLGGTGINGTVVANFTQGATTQVGRILLGFSNINSASVQEGENNGNGYAVTTAARTGAVDTSSAQTLYLTLVKVNGADVENLRIAKLIIRRGV